MSAYGRLARELRRQRQARKLRRKALDALDASEMVFARTREKPREKSEKAEQPQYVNPREFIAQL